MGRARHLLDLFLLAVTLGCLFQLIRWTTAEWKPAMRRIAWIAGAVAGLLIVFGVSLGYVRVNQHVKSSIAQPVQAVSYTLGILAVAYVAITGFWRTVNRSSFRPERRKFLSAAHAVSMAAPLAIAGYGTFLQRTRIRPREVRLVIPGLHKDLQGLRIVQLSDIHLSLYLSEREFAPAIDIANDAKPHLIAVTGDLISWRGDPLDACLNQLGRLRADAGVVGCLGNHEMYAQSEEYTTREAARRGIRFLRKQSEQLRFGAATLNVGGVDYQLMHKRYLDGAEALTRKEPGTTNLLLSHNPDVFPVAAAQGWDVTLAGHTHGGQVTVEYVKQYLNIARFYTPYISGLYQQNGSSIYVSQGIGTIGLPMRLGTEPEVGILTLCAT